MNLSCLKLICVTWTICTLSCLVVPLSLDRVRSVQVLDYRFCLYLYSLWLFSKTLYSRHRPLSYNGLFPWMFQSYRLYCKRQSQFPVYPKGFRFYPLILLFWYTPFFILISVCFRSFGTNSYWKTFWPVIVPIGFTPRLSTSLQFLSETTIWHHKRVLNYPSSLGTFHTLTHSLLIPPKQGI